MREYIFSEKEDIEKMISVGYVDPINPCKTIKKLARYNYYVLKKNDKDNYNEINSYMIKNCKEYTEVRYYKAIQGCIRDSSKSQWKDIDFIYITEKELDTISSIGDDKKEKIAFVILADAKYNNKYKNFNSNLSYLGINDIYKEAGVSMPKKERASFLHFLYEKKLIDCSLNPLNTNKKVNFICDDSKIAIKLDEMNYKSLDYTYLNWKYGGYKRCIRCGAIIKCNKNNKYCKNCAPKYEKKPFRIGKCIDCGKEFSVDPRNMTKCRCEECQKIHCHDLNKMRKKL